MIDLKNPDSFRELDPQDVYGSTALFTKQCLQMIDEYFDKNFYENKDEIKNVIICGMGGSAFGAHIALSLFQQDLKLPVSLISDYSLPSYVNQETMVILVSYSGTTEEVLSCAQNAKKMGAKISGFSSGGELAELLNGSPSFTFDPKNNPSGQPRIGFGYVVFGTLLLLNNLGVIKISKKELLDAIKEVDESAGRIKDEAQRIAEELNQKIPVILTSGHLYGNAHILRNQLNESSKTFSYFEDIPELNHHLMEGLKHPEGKNLKVLFLTSNHFDKKINNRLRLTQDVVSKNNIEWVEFNPNGESKLSDSLITLSFGAYISLYLGLIYGINPSLIPWVDYFKEELNKLP